MHLPVANKEIISFWRANPCNLVASCSVTINWPPRLFFGATESLVNTHFGVAANRPNNGGALSTNIVYSVSSLLCKLWDFTALNNRYWWIFLGTYSYRQTMPRSGITSYTRVIDLEQHQESEMEENDVNKSWIQPPTRDFPQRPPSHSFGRHMIFICCVAAAFLLGGFGGGVFLTTRWSASSESKGTPMTFTACKKPAVRREWRSLSRSEKLEYIQAVQCLRSKPSRLGLGHTLYDDFPYVHIHIGNDCRLSTQTHKRTRSPS